MYLLGIDLGTSSIKAALFGIDGTSLARVNREYLRIPEGEAHIELDGEAYWQATATAIRDVVAASGVSAREIRALSISSHGETLFLVDEAGRPVRPAIFTIDARATEEAAAFAASPGRAAIYALTGQPDVLPIWPAAKIAWLCKHEPDVVARTRRFLLPQGYVISRFCGRPADDPSVLTTSMLFDIWQRAWSPTLVAASGIEIDRLAEVLAPGSVAGTVSPAAAAETGLDAGTLVVIGALDQVCAAIAAGNIRPGVLTESTGSVLALLATAPQRSGVASFHPGLRPAGVSARRVRPVLPAAVASDGRAGAQVVP